MKKIINKRIIIAITIVILFVIAYHIYSHFDRYSSEKWLMFAKDTTDLDKISYFSFWWYIRTYEIASILAFVMPVLLVIAGVRSFFQLYRSGYLLNLCQRVNYTKIVKVELMKSWLSAGLILPFVSTFTLLISYICFQNPIILSRSETNCLPFLSVPDIMVQMNPYIFILIYTFLLFLFSIFIINIGIILTRYLKNMYLVMISSFITFIFVELLGQMIIGPLVSNITGIVKMANGFSIYNLYYLDAIPSLWWEIVFAILLVVVSTLIIYIVYKDKEKVLSNYE